MMRFEEGTPEEYRAIKEGVYVPDDSRYNPSEAAAKQIGGNHYKDMKITPTEYVLANNIDWLEANVIKYVSRHHNKNGVEDIDKAIHYLELIKVHKYAGN